MELPTFSKMGLPTQGDEIREKFIILKLISKTTFFNNLNDFSKIHHSF